MRIGLLSLPKLHAECPATWFGLRHSKNAGGQRRIGSDLIENSPEHYASHHQDSKREGHDCLRDFQRACQHSGPIVGGSQIGRPLDI